MAENRDVIEYPLAMLWRLRRSFDKKINGISDVYRNNSSNFETKHMRLSEDIYYFITEIIDVQQQFAEGYYFLTVTVKRSKNSFRY